RHTRSKRDWSSDVCCSDIADEVGSSDAELGSADDAGSEDDVGAAEEDSGGGCSDCDGSDGEDPDGDDPESGAAGSSGAVWDPPLFEESEDPLPAPGSAGACCPGGCAACCAVGIC